jgi:hypothetical protein
VHFINHTLAVTNEAITQICFNFTTQTLLPMNLHFLSLLSFIMFINTLFGQENLKPLHYFIYVKSETAPGHFQLEMGQYSATKNKLVVKEKYDSFVSLLSLLKTQECKGVLFYIHGFQADTKQFEKVTTKFLHDEVFSKVADKYDVIVSLKWTSGLEYKNSVNTALNKGKQFLPMVDSIISQLKDINPDLNTSFIIHSMGNRVFEGMMIEQKDKGLKWSLNNVLMYAPDIETNVFFTTLEHLPPQTKKCFVFYNIDDRTLAVAKMLRDHNRLGIAGHDDKEKLAPNVIMVNTTGLRDNKGLAANFTLHRYFYTSGSIRSQMRQILAEEL